MKLVVKVMVFEGTGLVAERALDDELVNARKLVEKILRHRHLSPDTTEIGISLPNNWRTRRTLHIQKDVLPYALC